MSIGNWYRVGSVSVTNGSANIVGIGTFWSSQCNPGDRFTIDGENWYEIASIADDTHATIQGVGGSGAFNGPTAANQAYAIDRNFTNNLTANIAASVASLVAQYQANSNGPLSGLFQDGAAATPGIAFLNEASTGWFRKATGVAALAVQGAEFLRVVGAIGGVPPMLGVGQPAPANALDVLTVDNALYGARVQNTSPGTSARASLQLGNGAQVLNVGVNGANFTTNGVLAPARGFVEGPNGVDFASGVTAGDAFSWGVGAGYGSKMSMDYQGNLTVKGMAYLGGANGSNSLTVNGGAANGDQLSVTGGSSGSGATVGIASSGASAPLALASKGAGAITVATNGATRMTIDSVGRIGAGATPSPWAGTINSIDIGLRSAISSFVSGATNVGLNGYNDGTNWVYKTTGPITFYSQSASGHQFFRAVSGSAGSIAAMVNDVTIDLNGNFQAGITGSPNHAFVKAVAGDGGNVILGVGNGSQSTINSYSVTVSTGSANSGNSAIKLGKDGVTGYSIRSAGVNAATGNDYAEYRQLIAGLYGVVAKGALLGYNASGLMTNVFADVVGRVLPKSTNPSYVGGDTWGLEATICAAYNIAAPGAAPTSVIDPVAPTVVADPGSAATGEEAVAYAAYIAAQAALPAQQATYVAYQTALLAYEARLSAFNTALESERVKWDRIALCGVVPVNIVGLTEADVGKYLVPCAASDGTITATPIAKTNLTLSQYVDSFGSIEAIGDDGRPLVNVKNA